MGRVRLRCVSLFLATGSLKMCEKLGGPDVQNRGDSLTPFALKDIFRKWIIQEDVLAWMIQLWISFWIFGWTTVPLFPSWGILGTPSNVLLKERAHTFSFARYLERVNRIEERVITLQFPEIPGIAKRPWLFSVVFSGILLELAIDPMNREAILRKIELLTSPNHAQPENKGRFRFRTLEEERRQPTQLDKGIHFLVPYVLTRWSFRALEYLGFPSNRQTRWLATLGVGVLSVVDEYLDGLQVDEGFSIFDFFANLGGVAWAWLKETYALDFVDIFWDYSEKPKDWKWAWWNYMDAYTFTVRIDLLRLQSRPRATAEPPLYAFWRNYVQYFPYPVLIQERWGYRAGPWPGN